MYSTIHKYDIIECKLKAHIEDNITMKDKNGVACLITFEGRKLPRTQNKAMRA